MIILILGFCFLTGLFFWGTACKAWLRSQKVDPMHSVVCKVIGKRQDDALDLHSQLGQLTKTDFLRNFQALSQEPMAQVEFPVMHTPLGVPMGRSPVQLTKALIDTSFAKITFPVIYRLKGKEYISHQEVFPVPLWLDPRPDFSREMCIATYTAANPQAATSPAVDIWQARLCFLAGLIFVVSSSLVYLFYHQTVTTTDDADADIDRIYNEMFKYSKYRYLRR